MTAVRRREKRVAAFLAVLLAVSCARFAHAAALVINPNTGLAISGFDPVAYFTDAKAEAGRPDFELSAEGAIWRFHNEGNRAAFAAHPEAYRPVFGGYDPVAIARERSVAGHPLVWAVVAGRLYLFYSADNRATFLAEPAGILARAEREWPKVEETAAR